MRKRSDFPASVLACDVTSERLFAKLSATALRDRVHIEITHKYPAGAVLFQEGELAEGIFVLSSGAVRLSLDTSHGDRMMLRLARPGEILGLSATMANTAHEVTAETTMPSELIFIRRRDFLHYLREHTEACLQVVEFLSNDVHAAYDRVRALGTMRSHHNYN
jgi:CRP/FNR family transcriptional regulator, cyclic AMP receptor protein